jgi:hypothetical protein
MERLAQGAVQAELARSYGVSQSDRVSAPTRLPESGDGPGLDTTRG